MKPPLCVLTIAGSDSGGGAGIQADMRTIEALGGHALTAITAVTAQDTRGVSGWEAVADRLVARQVEAALAGFTVAAAKTGLLPNAAAVRTVARLLSRRPRTALVVDPVIASTSGTSFLDQAGIAALRERLMPLAALVTPNWPEASLLSGIRVGSEPEAALAALQLAAGCGRPVLVKGGHATGRVCADVLALPDGTLAWFRGPRIATANSHGTGCVLSSAIATFLARGEPLGGSITRARAFLRRTLRRGRAVRWQGRGPAFVANA